MNAIAGLCDPTGRVFGLMPNLMDTSFLKIIPTGTSKTRGAPAKARAWITLVYQRCFVPVVLSDACATNNP